METSFYLVWPDEDLLRKAGFAALANAPFVLDSDWVYQEIPSKYLGDRARAKTDALSDRMQMRRRRFPTPQSMRNFGSALVNFLEWASANGLNWAELEYLPDLIEGYQGQMLEGRWSARGVPLAPRTINGRVAEACAFLKWAAAKGFRSSFDIPMTRVASPARSEHKFKTTRARDAEYARLGAVRVDPILLTIPPDEDVSKWLKSVLQRRGPTKLLMCRLIIETAIRREEAVQWQVDTLPLDRQDWRCMGDYVTVHVSHGAKGPKRRDERGSLIGPGRHVDIPLALAIEIERYRETVRPRLRARYVKSAKTLEEKRRRMVNTTSRLFLSDATGEPISAQRLYEAWVQSPHLPYRGWSPNCGRHYWSCKTLLRGLRSRSARDLKTEVYGDDHDPVMSGGQDIINLVIRPQLGHLSETTTTAYLVWVKRVLMLTGVSDAYERELGDIGLDAGG